MSSPTSRSARPGLRFVVTAAILSVSLFGIMRIPWIEQNLLLPFTKAQHGMACRIGGNPDAPISVGLSCSASDVIALCLGFVLAFPVAWRKRLVGAGLGLVLIAAVNTVRIATLSHAVENREWFDLLHVYIWPGVLLVGVSVFVFVWMSIAMRDGARPASRTDRPKLLARPEVRFILLTLLFVALFVGTSSWWMRSSIVKEIATWVALTGAGVIRIFGGEAEVTRNILRTASGAFIVTQECIMTPLIPAYFAAIFSLSLTRKQRILGLFASFPVFFLLGAARLLVLAIPTRVIGSHLVAIHGFYQFIVAALLVILAATITSPQPRSFRSLLKPVAGGLIAGSIAALVWALTVQRLVFWLAQQIQSGIGHAEHGYMDPQGALLIMGPYQIALFAGLWIAWGQPVDLRRGMIGLALLAVTQPAILIFLGEWVSHTGLEPHIAAIRAYAVLSVPLVAAWVFYGMPRRSSRTRLSPAEPQIG